MSQPGWYPDPEDHMRYWDGNAWKGAPEPRRPATTPGSPAGRAAGWCGSCWRWGSSRLRCWRGACSAGSPTNHPRGHRVHRTDGQRLKREGAGCALDQAKENLRIAW